MSKLPAKSPDSTQARVEQLTEAAKHLSRAGKEADALETYRQAAELMPGAPWLQHRTAELARKLKKFDLAVQHYRRAGAAFIGAGFPKRALGPLRTGFTLAVGELPKQPSVFVSLVLELAELQRALGFPADGALTISNANHVLALSGCEERVSPTPELPAPSEDKTARTSDPGSPPESGVKPNSQVSTLGILARFRTAPKS